MVSYHDRQMSKIIKNTKPSTQSAETQSEGSFHPKTTICTRLLIKMLHPAETNLHAKMCR